MKNVKKIIVIGTILYMVFLFDGVACAGSASKSLGILIKVVPAVTSSESEKVVDINGEGTASSSAQTPSSTEHDNTSPKPVAKNISQAE